MQNVKYFLIPLLVVLFLYPITAFSQIDLQQSSSEDVERLLALSSQGEPETVETNVDYLRNNWKDAYTAPLIEVLNYSRSQNITNKVVKLLADKTGVNKGQEVQAWYKWLWNKTEHKLENYGDFKAAIYGQIDPKFSTYFNGRTNQTEIRLDFYIVPIS